ncbi:MAG: hypothetical protein SPJ16_08865 [Helicobacter sp.]|uniref:hypothetical protein n=1 Tax=Helicobacter sp. TaxID=218 RepID=UPI002A914FB6|nr:hypothetical protein [Helicobacter sp.]MDY5951286.1 hypothetical protein [Helicobacter sp.]
MLYVLNKRFYAIIECVLFIDMIALIITLHKTFGIKHFSLCDIRFYICLLLLECFRICKGFCVISLCEICKQHELFN